MVRTLVTTSWDDGHPLDLRTAERLRYARTYRHVLRTALSSKRAPHVARRSARTGCHGHGNRLSHSNSSGFAELDEQAMFQELDGSKKKLEDLLGRPITSVCYPKGKFNRVVCEKTAQAGYSLARTAASGFVCAKISAPAASDAIPIRTNTANGEISDF